MGNAVFSGIASDTDPLVITGIAAVGTELVQTIDQNNPVSINPSTTNEGEFFLYTGISGESVIYYQYPHFSNGDGADSRFPLFEDLVQSCTDVGGFYAAGATYHYDALKLSDGSVPGLS